MMNNVIPLFKSHFSIGKSILTLKPESEVDNGPDSIVQIAKDNKLKKVFLVEDCFSGFLQAYKNLKSIDINTNPEYIILNSGFIISEFKL